jgi:Ca2+-transporting ATPase
MTFGSLVTAQLLHALVCRSDGGQVAAKARRRPPNRALTGALAAAAAIQGAGLLVPGLRGLLGVAPLGPLDAAITLGTGVLPYLVNNALRSPSTLIVPPAPTVDQDVHVSSLASAGLLA